MENVDSLHFGNAHDADPPLGRREDWKKQTNFSLVLVSYCFCWSFMSDLCDLNEENILELADFTIDLLRSC
ncbi:hypothetical protein Syun_026500 [Stephania yunnanensis]|uniref:Uncharacterized protein n=1 Tax=Stephania yunnanensis TaxID=152371 RepID=A0AAP0EWC3_9MAGN